MRKFHFTIDPTPRNKKPKKYEYGKLRNKVVIPTGWTVDNIVTYTSPPYSYSFAPAIYSGSTSNKNWVLQDNLMLDFDGGITPDEVYNKFAVFGIVPSGYYETFSSTKENIRFRVFLLLDEPITNRDLAKTIRKGLVDAFSTADKRCKDGARIFLGGIRTHLSTATTIPIHKLIEFISINEISKDKGKTRKIGQKPLLLYSHYSNNVNSSKQCFSSLVDPAKRSYLEKVRNNVFDFEECRKKVKILDDFLNGVWLDYHKIFGLATNMYWVQGGLKLMKETMEHYNKIGATEYTENNFSALTYARHYDYLPEWLSNFSNHPEDHKYTNLISAGKNIRGLVEVITPANKIPLQQAQERLEISFKEVMAAKDKNIYLVITSTGLGKTKLLTTVTGATICELTHDMVDEFKGRMMVDYVATPRMPKFENKDLNRKITSSHQMGLFNDVIKLLKSVAFFSSEEKYLKSDRKKAQQYLEEITKARNSDKTVITTHERAILSDFRHNTLIFDEDPLQSLIDNKTLEISDLMSLEHRAGNIDHFSDIIDALRIAEPGVIYDNDLPKIDMDSLDDLVSSCQTETNVLQFFKSHFYVKDALNPNVIHYTTMRKLPEDKKVIVLSATAQVEIYLKLYGDRVKVIEIEQVENMGEVIQDCSRSYSRSSLAGYDLDKLNVEIGDDPTITFMKYASKFNTEPMPIHFHNCLGYDFLKGRNINVLGTPHINPIVYQLYAKAMGLSLEGRDLQMGDQQVTWKGIRFPFNACNDPELRDIQLSLIEAELVQAVGRARTIRTDAKVMVYSNFPLTITDRFVA